MGQLNPYTPAIRTNIVPGNDGTDTAYVFLDDEITLKITGDDRGWYSIAQPYWQAGRLSYRAIHWDQPHRAMTPQAVVSWWESALRGDAA